MPKKSKKTVKNWGKWVILAIVLIGILILSIPTLNKLNNKNKTKPFVTEAEPTPIEVEPEEALKEVEGAQFGDMLKINYVLSLEDGTVVDTNNEELAKQHGLDIYVKGPFSFILGQSDKLYGKGGRIKTFDNALIGLREGEKKTILLEPSEDVLAFKFNLTEKKQRRTSMSAVHRFSKKQYEKKFTEQAALGSIVSSQDNYPWSYKIINISDKSVYGSVMLNEGDEIMLPGTDWKSTAVDVGERMITFEQNPEIGKEVSTPYGKAEVTDLTEAYIFLEHKPELGKVFSQTVQIKSGTGLTFEFKVWKVSEEDFIVRRTNYLQQEKLKLDVEILEIIPDVKEIK